jgi:hypothetical protein
MREIVPLIAIPDAEALGPAMQACTAGERAWVIAKIEMGCDNTEAARLAGYSDRTSESLRKIAHTVAHRERVQMALLEMSRKLMRTQGPKSIHTLCEIRDNKMAKDDVRLKAAVELLNRAGMSAVNESHLTVTHELSEVQMDQRILALAAELGLGEDAARKMLIAPADLKKNADAIDAEFTEATEPVSPEVQAQRDRKNEGRRNRRVMSEDERKADKARRRQERSERMKAVRHGIADLL